MWANKVSCMIGRHVRHGRSVWWDGYDFRSVCRHCGVPLYKFGNVRWRRVRNLNALPETELLSHDGATAK